MTDEVIDLPVTQTEAEAEASIAEGFNKVAGRETPAPVETPKTEAPKAEAKVEPKEPEKPDPWKDVPAVVRQHLETISTALPKFEQRLKSYEGVMGAIRAGQDAAKAAEKFGIEAPKVEQLKAAGTSSAKWDQLKAEFPDWGEALEERLAAQAAPALDAEALKRAIGEALPRDVTPLIESHRAEWIAEAESRAYVRVKHPQWVKTINTPEFTAWRQAQPPEINALGASEDADDAVRMLDLYAEHVKQVDAIAKKQAKAQERLAAAVPVEGSGGSGPTVMNEDEQLAEGYKRVRGSKG